MLDLNQKISSRTIRVFLSSTFRDMAVEREHLINTIFPVLRGIARERGVEITVVDLRWGITEDDVKSGNVIRLCMTEINECRKKSEELPFFIGVLGERYGWFPSMEYITGDRRLREEYPVVEQYVAQQLSVTEMEMRYAVLDRVSEEPELLNRSFFFFRDAAFTEVLRSQQIHTVLCDADDPNLSPSEKAHAAMSLMRLRQRIQEVLASKPPRTYRSEINLGEQVSRVFEEFLDKHFPKAQESTNRSEQPAQEQLQKLDQEQRQQALFAQSRLHDYVEREGWSERIAGLTGHFGAAVITGGVGSGKTALMSVAIAHIQKQKRDLEVLYHYCGGTPESDRCEMMLRRMIAELQRVTGQDISVPSDAVELPSAMIGAMYSIPPTKKVLLALDALDQLDDHKDLSWLPAQLPTNVQLLVSVKSPIEGVIHPLLLWMLGRYPLLCKYFPRVLSVQPLTSQEREAIIETFLHRHSKKIEPRLRAKIATAEISETPLILRALLEEMLLIGDHYALESQLERYIQTGSGEAFFDKVLERIEKDFGIGGDKTQGAAEVIALVGTSRRGLSETEILDLMNPEDPGYTRFTPLQWAGLHEVLRPHTKEQHGRLLWIHDMIRHAVGMRYARGLAACRGRLADYFLDEQRILTAHALQEWPWHLRLLDQRANMEQLFRQGQICVALLKENEAETHDHWLWLAQGQSSPADWIAKSAEQWVREKWANLWDLETLRNYLTERVGRPEQAVILGKEVVDQRTRLLGPDALDTISAKNHLASSYYSLNRHAEALVLFEEVLAQRTRLLGPDALDTFSAKNNLAVSYYSLNRYAEALVLFEEVLAQRTRLLGPDALDTISAKNNLALSYSALNRHAEALVLFEEVLAQRTRLLGPDALDTIMAKNNLASSYYSLNRHAEALVLCEEVLAQFTRLLGPDALDTITAKSNLALSYSSLNRHADALVLREEVLAQFTRLLGPDALDTIMAKNNLAISYSALNRHAEALVLFEEVLAQRTRQLGPDALDTIDAKQGVASSYSKLNRHAEAIALMEEVVEQKRQILGPNASDTIAAIANVNIFQVRRHRLMYVAAGLIATIIASGLPFISGWFWILSAPLLLLALLVFIVVLRA
jgi:tetratricopeptide (TPR) repeat protein